MTHLFITATDTDAGKTFVACAITHAFSQAGYKVAVYKPISAGCQREGQTLVNEDAKLLTQFANAQQSLSDVNPIAFFDAIAPHIAASKVNYDISLTEISQGFNQVKTTKADITITEGAGGWRLPLSTKNNTYLSDFAKSSEHKVILIVNMKLGCLNHALLTYEAIKADGLDCIAWIANSATEHTMSNYAENITALEQLLPIPKIGQLSFFNDNRLSTADKIKLAAKQLNINAISLV